MITAFREKFQEELEAERIKNRRAKEIRTGAAYKKFEDKMRGTRQEIKNRLKIYEGVIQKVKETNGCRLFAMDLGCGRGEWLELMQEQGIAALGIDKNESMIQYCKKRRLDVVKNDLFTHLKNQSSDSVDILTAFQVVEHLHKNMLADMLKEAYRVLRPGGVLILETPNPENLIVGTCIFYFDPTHIQKIPPKLLQILVEDAGLTESEIVRLHPYPGIDMSKADKNGANYELIEQMAGFFNNFADYLHGNDFTLEYLEKHWDGWFTEEDKPDVALIAGWPFYRCIAFLREKCGYAVFHDYGAVPTDGMSEPKIITQKELRRLRKENLRMADRVIAISSFIESSQSGPDTDHTIPTSYVHLGADHMDMAVWQQEGSGICKEDVLTEIRTLKERGYRLILQPGRWEKGNYKNSAAGFQIARILKKRGFRIKMLVLSERQDMEMLPKDVEDCYYCMGHIDDLTRKAVMECADVGFSPTLWEGFDLPLAEMQYLYRHMYVYDLGAHPEVAAHPFFLCRNEKEAAGKICQELAGELPVKETELRQALKNFHQKFTWEKCVDTMLHQMQKDMVLLGTLFMDVTNACHDTANSGVMRVTRKIARQMQKKMETVFVIWDESTHKYVFPFDKETDLLCEHQGADEEQITYRSQDGCARACLDDVWSQFGARRKVLLLTETMNYKNMQYIISYMHKRKVAVAAVFYDAIPVLRADLCSSQITENHKYYMAELASADVVIPIAAHNGLHLKKYWEEQGIAKTSVKTVELAGEMDDAAKNRKKISRMEKKHRILFVSTLEPRKNHKRFLEAFIHLMNRQPQLKTCVSLVLVGNKYAGNDEIPHFVEDVCRRHKNIKWYGVVDDAKLRRLYRECTFTVYPSEIEGYGMPVMESLWFGKPCLCSKSGSIGELGAPGGCCLTDVFQTEEIENSLYRMLTDEAYYIKLQHEAVDREIVTWDTYTDGIVDVLEKTVSQITEWKYDCLTNSLKMQIRRYLAEKNDGDRVIICSNYYPPGFIGGAEIIAHSQSKVLANDKSVPVIVFSMDMSGKFNEGYCYLQHYDGLQIVRYCVLSSHMNPSSINFFHKGMNEAFRQLCELVKPTVVHGHNMIGMSLGMLEIAKKSGAAVCMTFHDHWGFCLKNTILDSHFKLCDHISRCETCMSVLNADGIYIPVSIRQAYFKKVFEYVDTFLSPSRYLADAYVRAGFSWHRMRQLWYGIDTEKYAKVRKKSAGQHNRGHGVRDTGNRFRFWWQWGAGQTWNQRIFIPFWR